MISINFDNLLADYNNQLGLKLRGDRTNEEHLQFWVPSEDITESLLNLIDSLKETHNLKFEIKVDTKIRNINVIKEGVVSLIKITKVKIIT